MGKVVSKCTPCKKKKQTPAPQSPTSEPPTLDDVQKQESQEPVEETYWNPTDSYAVGAFLGDFQPPKPRVAFEEDTQARGGLRMAAIACRGEIVKEIKVADKIEKEEEDRRMEEELLRQQNAAEDDESDKFDENDMVAQEILEDDGGEEPTFGSGVQGSAGLRPLSAYSVTSLHSSLSLASSSSSSKRLQDWRRSTDRNLCQVYRLCEEYLSLGRGQRRPELHAHIRGIDFTFGRRHIRPASTSRPSSPTSGTGPSTQDGGFTQQEKAQRAKKVLLSADYFKSLDSSTPGIVDRLAGLAEFGWESANQLIVRQGDPSGSMYLLVNGEMGVHMIPAEKLQATLDRSPRPEAFDYLRTITEEKTGELSPISAASAEGGKKRSSVGKRGSQSRRRSASGQEESERYRTLEGFSTFTLTSNIGRQMSVKLPGAIFGEDGMQKGGKRKASMKCITDCEFLVVKGKDYLEIMFTIVAKTKFFDKHLPGCKVKHIEGEAKIHSSSFFLTDVYKQGHKFLSEGILSQAVIYFIERGTIEFRRCEDPVDDPALSFSDRPGPVGKAWSEQSHATLSFDRLSTGDLFCSLGAFPVHALEPFTAVVTSPDCKVFYCHQTRFDALPEIQKATLKTHLMQCLASRLLRVRDRVPEAFLPIKTQALFAMEEAAKAKQRQEDRRQQKVDMDNALK